MAYCVAVRHIARHKVAGPSYDVEIQPNRIEEVPRVEVYRVHPSWSTSYEALDGLWQAFALPWSRATA